jgi:ferrous-iron efflux pump FieF
MPTSEQNRLALLASRLSVAVAVILIVAKAMAWSVTDSVSILASLADSSMDALVSIVNLMALRYALSPADDDHRFGHGKAEAIAAVSQAAFIVGSSLILVFHCVERFASPEQHAQLSHSDAGIAVMLFSMALTLALVAVQGVAVKRSGSAVVKADRLHYLSDLLTNVSVLVALVLARFGLVQADVIIGLAVAAYLCFGAIRIGQPAMQMLMDHELPAELSSAFVAIARRHPKVVGVHDIRTRQSGLTYVVQLHLEMNPATSLAEAHAISDEVEEMIASQYPNTDIIIHLDPAGLYERLHTLSRVP